jgi:hypothetical protein
MIRAIGSSLLVAALTILSGTAAFAVPQESGTLICATVDARGCVRGEVCLRGLAEDIGAAQFFPVNPDVERVQGAQCTTPIAAMDTIDGHVLLHRKESGVFWIIAVDRANGRFPGILTNVGGAFVLFANGTPSSRHTGTFGAAFAALNGGWWFG